VLTRKPVADGAQFSNGAARFWTDGKKVVVEGTATRLENCKRKAN
jgi:membrane-bound inhibitor of C-type lysozyme